ncbi:MAG TPA: hypothetical protein VGY97_05715 [Solirubrobacteraceae bacterium]|nr:hypothetical protein [Solirubrobacteraceae bacterium]
MDVTAVVLTVGDEPAPRAIASLRRQTLLPQRVLTVADVTPFHRALNRGAEQVRTTFFVQVDSDMVLDSTCVAELRSRVSDGVVVVAAPLRDPLMGMVMGVKIFRTECFEALPMRDTISPDTDFCRDLREAGWFTVYAVRPGSRSHPTTHTLGEHSPAYTPAYTYATHYVLGARYRYRGDLALLAGHLRNLSASRHPAAPIARAALGHGAFLERAAGLPKDQVSPEGLELLRSLSRRAIGAPIADQEVLAPLTMPVAQLLAEACRLGTVIAEHGSGNSLRRAMDVLARCEHPLAWVAEMGIHHGLLARRGVRGEDIERVAALIPSADRWPRRGHDGRLAAATGL